MKNFKRYRHPLSKSMHGELTLCFYCGFLEKTELWVKNNWHCPICDHDEIHAIPW